MFSAGKAFANQGKTFTGSAIELYRDKAVCLLIHVKNQRCSCKFDVLLDDVFSAGFCVCQSMKV